MNPILKLVQQVKDAEGITLAAVIEKVEKIRVSDLKTKDDVKKVAQALMQLRKEVQDIPLDKEVKKLLKTIDDAEKRLTESLSKEVSRLDKKIDTSEETLRQEIDDKIPDVVTITERVNEIEKGLTDQDYEAVIAKVLEQKDGIRDALESLEGDERLDASAIKNLPQMQTLTAGGGSNVSIFSDGTFVGSSTRINFTGATVTNEGGRVKIAVTGGGGISDGDKGDVTVASSGAAWTVTGIQDEAVQDGNSSDGDILVYRTASSAWVREAKPAGGSNPAWGDITGTLANQTDLQAALDAKQNILSEGAFVNGDKTKLDGIEPLADVTDTANVTAAGALMDSEVTNLAAVKAFDPTDYAAASHTHTESDITDLKNYQIKAVANGSLTAVNDTFYVCVSTSTFTDPSPTEGEGFAVLVRNGTATVGGTGYSTAGTIIHRTFHSGSWTNYVYQVSSTFATASHTHTLSDVTDVTASAAEVNVLDGIPGTLTATELGYVDGVTSAIQTQLDAKQPLDSELTAIAGLTSAADRLPYFTGSGTASLATFTSTARNLLDDTSTTAMRTTLGVGTGDSPQFTAVNIGNATDTTVARVSAGQISVEGVQVATASNTLTLTNKTLTSPVISSISNTGTLTLPTSTDTLVGRATTDTLTNKTLTAPTLTGTTTADRIDYDRAVGGVNAIGNLGATETIDWSTHTHFTGTLDSNITFTYSNQVSGQTITLYLAYDGAAQRTITWPTTTWLDNATGAAPTSPAASGNVLVVTLVYVGTTTYGSATGNYAVYA